MKILITGGTGFIGKAFIEEYKNKYSFTVITRKAERLKNKLGSHVRYLAPDYLDAIKDLNEFDAVINLAGEGIADANWSEDRKQLVCKSRWHITQQLVDLINASKTPPTAFISGSAIGIYGRQDSSPIDEKFSDYHEEFGHLVCKRWEQIALQANTRVCIIRTGIVLGKGGGALKKMLLPFKLGLGGPMGDGEQYMSWIQLQDELKAIDFLLQNEQLSGAFNLTAPNAVSNRDFSKTLAKTLHRPCIFTTPAFVLSTLLGEMSEILLFGQNVVPNKLLAAGFEFTYPNLADALKASV
jgi:uncharacterized protein (TIGR01777 family)